MPSIDKAVTDAAEQIVGVKVREAITKSLGKDPAALVQAVVTVALEEQSHGYPRQTMFMGAVNGMIREVAQEEVKAFLEEVRPRVRAAIVAKLRHSPEEFAERVAEQMVNALGTSFYTSFHLKAEGED